MHRVLFLGWEFYPVFTGGLGIVCSAMANEMAEQDLEVFVALPSVPKEIRTTKLKFPNLQLNNISFSVKNNFISKEILDNLKFDSYSNFEDYKISKFHKSSEELNFEEIRELKIDGELYGADLLEKVLIYKELVKNFALDLEFDVVHAHDWMTFLAALEVRNVTGKKCVLHVHATEIDRTADNPHELIFNIEKYVLNEADKVIAISEYIKNTLIERYGVDSSKIEVIHNALSSEHTHDINYSLNISKGKTVMFLGRAVVQKGVETFIQIAKRVLEKLPDTTFIFAGDGPLLPYVIDKVCQLGIQDNVIFAGSVDRYEGDVLFSTADLYLMTSISEPFGITALEAINQGTPVIITKTSGANEVLPNALKADFWDIDKFADFTVNILQDEILYEELLENQRKDFSKLTWKNQVEKMIGIYSTLINSYEDNSIV